MSRARDTLDEEATRIDDAALRHVVETLLRETRDPAARIVRFDRRVSPYRTSAALEELDVELAEGTRLPMMFKNAGRDAMGEGARRVKPPSLYDPRREIAIYHRVLDRRSLGTPMCYGAVVDEPRGRYWLFLERVPGVELYQVGELATWKRVACWLAATHVSFARRGVPRWAEEVHALTHDPAYYRLWLDRARRVAAQEGAAAGAVTRLEWLASRYDAIIERLAALPVTLIHGEFYASNVLVHEEPTGWRVCPVDWETAAVGPGVMDLAALTLGWAEPAQRDIAMAYHAALLAEGDTWVSPDALLADLACGQIQSAVQWFAWFGRDQAPAEHARDWLGDAVRVAEALRL